MITDEETRKRLKGVLGMKRFLALLCLVALMVSCACAEDAPALRGYQAKAGYVYLTLGECPQEEDGGLKPILWRVLSVENDRAYLLSEYVLEARPIHSDYQEYANKPTNKKKPGFNGDFTQTEMSQYLNGDFATNCFTDQERAMLTPDEEFGLFFLVSDKDLKNKEYGFTSDESRKAWGTPYALSHGLFQYMATRGSHSPYWTRTQSTSDARHARCIKSKGELGRINVITLDEGMRPACYLDTTKAEITGGQGTKDDPYVLTLLADTQQED